MNCPTCNKPLDPGAAFCGNCGTPVAGPDNNLPASFIPAAAGATPSYALAAPVPRADETKATLSLIFGVIGLAGCYFMAVLGLVFGIAGIVLGTISRQSVKKGMSVAGIVVSSLAILAGLAVWVYFISQDPHLHNQTTTNTNKVNSSVPTKFVAASYLSTPCYSAGFTSKLNISNSKDSCDMSAFDGSTMETSSELYKVYANQTSVSEDGFSSLAKSAIESDVQSNLPGYTIKSEKAGQFADSTAYIVDATNSKANTDVVEAAIYHATASGDNLFVIVHAVAGGDSANLNSLEAQWQWK